jgi:hypothetical protein
MQPAANSKAFVGEELTLVPVSMDQISRLKNKKVWSDQVPGAWITHAKPEDPKPRGPKRTPSESENLFERMGRL